MEFMSVINSIGTVPLLILILVICILLIKDIKKETSALARQIANQNTLIEKLESRIRDIEMDYAQKTYVQEINSSWRQEIRRIDEKLDKVLFGK